MNSEAEIVIRLFRKARGKTIEICHAIPEVSLYETHPPYGRTFVYTLLHIAEGEEGWLHGSFKDGGPEPEYIDWDAKADRMTILAALERSNQRMVDWLTANPDRLTAQLGGWAEGETALDRLVYLLGHEVNHQTQMLTGLERLGLDFDIFMPF